MRIIAFDLGKVRTGVAISDESAFLAFPAKVITKSDPSAILAEAVAAIAEYGAVEAVVGLALRSDSGEGEMAAAAREFAAALHEACGIPVVHADERYSTVVANRYYNEAGKKGAKERRKTIDAAAAAVILQDYLDSRKKT